MLSALYAAAVRRRRERYAARPELRRRLRRPVISVGNLATGGRGKTPLVASIARLLLNAGERPAILSRGYARAQPDPGVVVVRDPQAIRADLARAGDEPLMLARQLPGASVLVCPDRYVAGRLAEHHLGASVHILDDGFQHLQLDRDIDLVLVGSDDVGEAKTLPAGHLREPIDTIVAADAVLACDDNVVIDIAGADLPIFRTKRSGRFAPRGDDPVLALAGIAAPARFFADLAEHGWNVAGTMAFGDHHRYTSRDARRIMADAACMGAVSIVTTEKDYVRLLPFRPFPMPVVPIPITLTPDPLERFREWLMREVGAVRGEPGG